MKDKALIRAFKAKYRRDWYNFEARILFVSQLSLDITENDLQEFFSRYGKLKNVKLVRDCVTGMSKRYAFITFNDTKSLNSAYKLANERIINNCRILVEIPAYHVPDWKPRRLGGGYGGKKHSGQLRFSGRWMKNKL